MKGLAPLLLVFCSAASTAEGGSAFKKVNPLKATSPTWLGASSAQSKKDGLSPEGSEE